MTTEHFFFNPVPSKINHIGKAEQLLNRKQNIALPNIFFIYHFVYQIISQMISRGHTNKNIG